MRVLSAWTLRFGSWGGLATLAAVTALAGCSDPKAASKANFKKALAAYFEKNCAMLPVAAASFPYSVETDPTGRLAYSNDTGLSGLVDAGILTKKFAEHDEKSLNGIMTFPHYYLEFALTPKGQALWRPSAAVALGFPGGICAGTIQVMSVDNFTEPAVAAGATVSQVTFTQQTTYDRWTTTPSVRRAFADSLGHARTEQQTLPMQLTNNGWEPVPAAALGAETP